MVSDASNINFLFWQVRIRSKKKDEFLAAAGLEGEALFFLTPKRMATLHTPSQDVPRCPKMSQNVSKSPNHQPSTQIIKPLACTMWNLSEEFGSTSTPLDIHIFADQISKFSLLFFVVKSTNPPLPKKSSLAAKSQRVDVCKQLCSANCGCSLQK